LVPEIQRGNAQKVAVFCSLGAHAVDPDSETNSRTVACAQYRILGSTHWQPMPKAIEVKYPFRPGKEIASAFVVSSIHHPVRPPKRPPIEWVSLNNGPWRDEKLPTRGEYLIRRGGQFPMRDVTAVLELKSPYFAEVAA